MVGRDKIHHQGNGVGALRTNRVTAIGGVEKFSIEDYSDFVRLHCELLRLMAFAEHRGGVRKIPSVIIIERRRRQRIRRQLGGARRPWANVIPVAQAVRECDPGTLRPNRRHNAAYLRSIAVAIRHLL
jgi:hypothetical protein